MNGAMRRIAGASFVGALLEWYDFYVFATASALVFGPLFFPSGDPLLSRSRRAAKGRAAWPSPKGFTA